MDEAQTATVFPPTSMSLRPLQNEGRCRELDVEAQLRTLVTLPFAEFWRRAQQTDRSASDFIKEEALVYLLREHYRNGDMKKAGDIAELLVRRSSPFLHKHIAVWRLRSPAHVEECAYEVQSCVWQDLFNLAPSCEFWEVRFWVCLKRRILNCVQKYRTLDTHEFNPDPLEDGKGNATPVLETWADLRLPSPQDRLEIQEALAVLPDKERITFILWHYEEWTQEEIAGYLKLSDRAVRYRLERAHERLAVWRAESLK